MVQGLPGTCPALCPRRAWLLCGQAAAHGRDEGMFGETSPQELDPGVRRARGGQMAPVLGTGWPRLTAGEGGVPGAGCVRKSGAGAPF